MPYSAVTKKKRGEKLFYGLNIIIPLVLGLIIYLLFRRDSRLFVFISRFCSIPSSLNGSLPLPVEAFFRNFASDMLWAYSLTCSVIFVLGYSHKNMLITFLICVCFEIVIEIMQHTSFFHGTFDVLDIILEMFSTCLALIIIKKYEEEKT